MAQTKKYLMFISYVGSSFRGSQLQPFPAVETVQNVVEKGLKHVFQLEGERPITINLASRTDAGVHALKAAVTVALPPFKFQFLQPPVLAKLLNYYFIRSKNKEVRILEAFSVPDTFHFSKVKKEKTYLYRFGFQKQEFLKKYGKTVVPIMETNRTLLMSFNKSFDLKKAQEATQLFEGLKDFGAIIGKASKNNRPTICNILSFKVEESHPLFPFDPLCNRFNFYHIICKGDRFLFHMVRRMVSLIIGVGFHTLSLENIQELFDKPCSSSWPKKAYTDVPGYGLYLIDMDIDFENFLENELIEENEVSLNVNNKELIS